MLARDVMLKGSASIAPDRSVLDAATLLVNANSGTLAVVDEADRLVGVVSEADVIAHIAALDRPGDAAATGHRVSDIMTKTPVSVEEDASLKSVIEIMLGKRLKVVPVCRGAVFTGVVTRAEVMRLIVSRAVGSHGALSHAEDDAVRRQVVTAVKGQRWSLAQRFDVIVKDGTVHLWGVVPNDQVHSAYCEAAENVPGAKAVVSHMHVMPHGVRMNSVL